MNIHHVCSYIVSKTIKIQNFIPLNNCNTFHQIEVNLKLYIYNQYRLPLLCSSSLKSLSNNFINYLLDKEHLRSRRGEGG